MKVYQLLTVPFVCDMDFEDLKDMAGCPNALFSTLEKAKAAAMKDSGDKKLVWTPYGMHQVNATSNKGAMTYAICETEVQ